MPLPSLHNPVANPEKAQHPALAADDGSMLTTGEMARCSNNTLRTVRFYEEEGILRPARRTDGGHRLFPRSELDRLMLITDMRLAGLSLDEIKHILEVKQTGLSGSEAALQATQVLSGHIEELRDKLLVLTRLRDDLAATTDIMTACVTCHNTQFPSSCASCSVMASPATLPRSMRVLWSTATNNTTNAVPPKTGGSGNGHAG
jgi:MerR family Zn(II)-responsive transcriptional regulator of zntA